MNGKKLLLAGLLFLTVLLGFYRDHLFVSMNHTIETGNDMDGHLGILKWVLTLVFSLAYLIITSVFLHVIFRKRKYIVIAVLVYTALFIVAVFSMAAGLIATSYENAYPFVRTVMGIAQSPIVAMILIPSFLINEATKQAD